MVHLARIHELPSMVTIPPIKPVPSSSLGASVASEFPGYLPSSAKSCCSVVPTLSSSPSAEGFASSGSHKASDDAPDLGVQFPLAAEQLVEAGLEKAPASCSSFTSVSLSLDALRLEVDHEQPSAASGNQAVQDNFEADELMNSIPSLVDCPRHAPDLVVNNQSNSTDY
ncbi:hypothetical protein Nepgr_028926 [Nepenthes gracilis]|uniref:Uncharacterized protein n=1 Tax=Nepenthes gracilis TaxID=150966 RepID=A0AAD3TD66_NEPGR|nr:hypothetical protein Nepgr_028926 [Nepenthes gracilis]